MYLETGRYSEAEDQYRRSLTILEQTRTALDKAGQDYRQALLQVNSKPAAEGGSVKITVLEPGAKIKVPKNNF